MDRYWLLTNTCYGTWLPGDARGFVGQVLEHRPYEPDEKRRIRHDLPGTPHDEDLPGLVFAASALVKGQPIELALEHAEVLLGQFQETAEFRGWDLLAVAIMFNHFHIVVGVPGDPKPAKILGDFKSWATRTLSQRVGAFPSETWWTERGSKRKLPDEAAIAAAVHYVLHDQFRPLITWSPAASVEA